MLSRAIYKKGRALFLKLGGEEVEYDPGFTLYLQTKLSNPHYKPEIAAQCTLINFIATEAGLEDQLLAKVVGVERPDLEKQQQELQSAFVTYKIQLMELEDDLLERLANAPDDILSDVPLIEGLEATKAASKEINAALDKGKTTQVEINIARENYRKQGEPHSVPRPVCTYASCISRCASHADSLIDDTLAHSRAARLAPQRPRARCSTSC